MRPRISITGHVRPSVGRSVGRSVGDAFVKNKENHYFRPNNCRRRYTRQISCNHIIIQSFNHHEDASLALWALFFHIIHRFFFPVVKLQKLRLWVFWTSKSVHSFGSYGLAKWGCHDWKKKKVVFFTPIVFKKPSLTLYHKLNHSRHAQSLPRSSLGTNVLNSDTYLP